MSAPEFLQELQAAFDYEVIRINGYNELLTVPHNLISQESLNEVVEAITWSNNRLALLDQTITFLGNLIAHGYPAREQQVASVDVVAQLRQTLENMRLAVEEFQVPITGSSIVSDQIKV
jgi:hypothetical protein